MSLISYDLNGNMTSQGDKGILGIQYNYLNLPDNMIFNQTFLVRDDWFGLVLTKNITTQYLYRADGTKLKKTYNYGVARNNSEAYTITDYLDGFQYEGQAVNLLAMPILKFVPTAEGYYNFENNKYIYNYTDHLGNVRLSYSKNSNGSAEVLDENNYYPFGLKHGGYNPTSGSSYQYKYNGKELQTDSGMYDYGARFYMPDLGRWGVIDPKTELGRRFSPYNYAFDNPTRFIDPDGMWPWPTWGQIKNTYNNAKTQVQQKYQQAKAYTSQKYDEGKTYVTQKYNEGKTYATKKYNDAKVMATEAKNTVVNSAKEARTNAQNWVKENKTDLLSAAKAMQTTGDAASVSGIVMAAVGAPIGGVGATPGLTVATAGTIMSNIGTGVEFATNLIAGDLTAQDGANTISEQIIGKGVDAVIDAIVPGPTPNISTPASQATHEMNKAASEVMKQTTTTALKPEEL